MYGRSRQGHANKTKGHEQFMSQPMFANIIIPDRLKGHQGINAPRPDVPDGEELLRRYSQGWSLKQLADQYKCSRSLIHKRITKARKINMTRPQVLEQDLNTLAKECWTIAEEHGFHEAAVVTAAERTQEATTKLLLMVTEISEAFEDIRDGQDPADNHISTGGKPEGPAVELADLIIRALDYAYMFGIDIEELVRTKMAYNATREYRHGKRF
jgi:NTP pyrophosphatase (non-canonical NTP hydrolase)